MSSLNPARSAGTWEAGVPSDQRRRPRTWQSYLSIAAMIVPALLLLAVGLIAGSPPAADDIERGVTIGSFEVDGDGWEQSEADLQASFDTYLDSPLTLQVGDRQVEVTPAELGISYDVEATHERALGIGRGNFFTAAGERFVAHTSGYDVEPVVVVDEDAFLSEVTPLADEQLVAPVNATFYVDGEQIAVRPSQDGVGVDPAVGLETLLASAVDVDGETIVVPTTVVEPEVKTAELEAILEEAALLSDDPLVMVDQAVAWQFTPADLAALITYRDGEIAVDREALAARLQALAPSIEQLAQNADLVRAEDGSVSIADGMPERRLDVDASSEAVAAAILADEPTVNLVVNVKPAAVSHERLLPLYRRLTEIITRGVTVSWSEGARKLDPKAFSDSIVWNEISGEFWFDHAKLAEAINPAAQAATRAPTNLRWLNGQVVVGEGSQPGIRADVAATIPNVIDAAMHNHEFAELVMHQDPSVDPATLGIEIKQVLGSSTTFYGDSSANRKTNIEVAARALNGALIPPHSEFSFNDAIGGTTTLEDGYMMGYGIVSEGGEVRTVPSVAGGICQVATTTFQAAFWAGMPITHRTWHLYWIPRYGSGPGGMQGLDATVDPEFDLDFNFANPTDQWLAVTASADGQNLTVEVWGVHQGWTIQVDQPVITNVVKASQEIVRRTDGSLAPGQEVWVEQAQDGFNASIHRVVKDAQGNVVDDTTFESYYIPAQNVILVGPS